MQTLHANATTTIKKRKYIQKNSYKKDSVLARELGISETTVRRWKKRDSVFDYSCKPHNLHCSFTSEQEAVIVELRTTLLLSLDDLLALLKEFINPMNFLPICKNNWRKKLSRIICHDLSILISSSYPNCQMKRQENIFL